MATIPVICRDCGRVGAVDRLIGGTPENLRLSNVAVGDACPNCGGDMQAINGIYGHEGGETRLRRSSVADVEAVNELLDILQEARDKGWTKSQILSAIEDAVPDFTSLAEWLPESVDARQAVLLVLLTLLGVVSDWYYHQQTLTQDRRQHRERMEELRQYHEEMIEQAAKDTSGMSREEVRKIVRRIIEEQASN